MKNRIWVVLVVVAAVAGFFILDLGQYISLDHFTQQKQSIQDTYQRDPLLVIGAYFLIYLMVAGLSLPGAAVLTLAGGAIFGLLVGVIVVSFASSIGATIAFWVSRYLLRDWVQNRYGRQLATINEGIRKEGGLYLFMIRMVLILPYFIVNLVMGVTPIQTLRFYLTSQIGMLMGTVVYVYAGTQLATIESTQDILTPGLLSAIAMVGILPLVAKKITTTLAQRRRLKGYSRPTQFDTNVVVIGAGSAGLVAAVIASTVKAKITLIEQNRMGGDCLNTGCVPSKTLIRSAQINTYISRADEFGIEVGDRRVDFSSVMRRVQDTIKTIEPHDSVERYTGLGVDCVKGRARVIDPWSVEVNGSVITTRSIIVATGAKPFVPPIPGLEQIDLLTSDNVWALTEMPENLLILGGGPIGCELAQSFSRLGSVVTLVDMADRILPREDADVAAIVQNRLVSEGVNVLVGHRAVRFEASGEQPELLANHNGDEVAIKFDKVLVAVGRRADTKALGLDALGIGTNPDGTIELDKFLQTVIPSIYACGDVAGPYQFTHMASHQAWYATVNALFGRIWRFRVDYSVVPWATYTDPEVATVGLNEISALERGINYDVTRFELSGVDRAVAEGETQGFIKVLTVPGKDKVLGATIVGHHAGELIGEYVTAMTHGLGLNKLMSTIHIYPTFGEVNKFAASNWKKANAPEKLLEYVGKFHTWARG
jgi:dihydrolipoamide dehydrogenase